MTFRDLSGCAAYLRAEVDSQEIDTMKVGLL